MGGGNHTWDFLVLTSDTILDVTPGSSVGESCMDAKALNYGQPHSQQIYIRKTFCNIKPSSSYIKILILDQ